MINIPTEVLNGAFTLSIMLQMAMGGKMGTGMVLSQGNGLIK
jgi:hypothetical protein